MIISWFGANKYKKLSYSCGRERVTLEVVEKIVFIVINNSINFWRWECQVDIRNPLRYLLITHIMSEFISLMIQANPHPLLIALHNWSRGLSWFVKKMETDKNHIHLLIQYNPTDRITKIVSLLKQHITWQIWKRHYKKLSHHYWKEHTFWSDGYFAASIGEVSQSTIEHYIENQG